MGSKTQIALPDLDDGQTEDVKSAQRPETSRQQKTGLPRRGGSGAPSGQADVIPAFIPGNRLGMRDEDSAGKPEKETPGGDQPDEEEENDLPAAAEAGGATGNPLGHNIEDPELIELLEQLSATIDNANQVLSETPPLMGPVADEYAAAGATSTPLMPPKVAVERRSRTGSLTALVLSGVFLCTAAGGYWWFKTNPWLLDESPAQNSALSVTRDRNAAAGPSQVSVKAKLPEPTGAAPLPARASEPERMTASLTAPAVPAQPEKAVTDTPGPAHGPAGSPIAIDLVLPDKSDGQEVSVMIQGVPKGVTLESGSFIGGGTWVLTEQEAANLVLNTPASYPPQDFELDVVFVKSDGKVPKSRKIAVVVDPAHAPVTPATHGSAAGKAGVAPPASAPAKMAVLGPASGGAAANGFDDKAEPEEKTDENTAFSSNPGSSLPREEEQKLLSRGDELIGLGDVASARLIFAHAARLGSKSAMLALGKTFDPDYLAKLGVRGVQPDKAQATAWYKRASRKADR